MPQINNWTMYWFFNMVFGESILDSIVAAQISQQLIVNSAALFKLTLEDEDSPEYYRFRHRLMEQISQNHWLAC